MSRFIVVQRQAHLFEVIAALHSSGGFSRRLHSWQKQGDQDANDRYDYQEFYQRESACARDTRAIYQHKDTLSTVKLADISSGNLPIQRSATGCLSKSY